MAQRWEVNLTPDDTPSGDSAEVISEAVVRGINVRVPQGPVVSEMLLALREVEFDPATNEIEGAKQARMTGTFRAEDLERFVGSQETGPVDRLHIHCRPGDGCRGSDQPAAKRMTSISLTGTAADTSRGGAGGANTAGSNDTSRSSKRVCAPSL